MEYSDNKMRVTIKEKNKIFLMSPEKAARLKKNLRKISWTDEQYEIWQKTRAKIFNGYWCYCNSLQLSTCYY